MEIGIYTFGDIVKDPKTGRMISPKERMSQMIEMARFADEVGLDLLGVGEHHSLKFVNSATATTLAAMAMVTRRIRLTSSTTLIGTADPVRTFQEFATADLASGGRIELIFGRGAYADNFPLFGFDTKDYDELFIEKVQLFAQLNAHERVTWRGKFRAPLYDAEIAPRPVQKKLPVWIGAGSPASIVRAAQMGYPVAIPVLGGSLTNYARLAALYKETWTQGNHAISNPGLAVFSHIKIADNMKQVREDFYPYYSAYLEPLFNGPMPTSQYEYMLSPEGSLIAGGIQEVAEKLLFLKEEMGVSRYVGQIDIGGQPFADVLKGIEWLATKIAPLVKNAG